MTGNTAVLFSQRTQVRRGESLFNPAVGFVEAFRALSREMREERGLELYDIGYHVRRSESAISKFETGETKQPDHLDDWLDGYASAFGMPTTELIDAIARRMGTDETQVPESALPETTRAIRQASSGRAVRRPAKRRRPAT